MRFLLIIIITAIFAVSCGQSTEEKIEKKTMTLRLGMNMNEKSVMYQAANNIKNKLTEMSGGDLTLEIYPSQQLGTDQQMVEMAINGDLDLVLTPTAKLSYLIPSMAFFDIPFMLPAKEDVYNLIDGEFGKLLFEDMQQFGLTGIAIWENGFKQFTSNTPLRNTKDFEGLTFRIMKNPVIYDQFKVLKATPVPIDFYKTYDALRDGAVDGEENPLVAIYLMKFYEQQKYLTISNHAYLGYAFYISNATMHKLTPDQQELLFTLIKQETTNQRKEAAKQDAETLDKIKEYGITIDTLSAKEKENFRIKLAGLRNKYWSVVGDGLMKTAENYLFDKYGMRQDDSYVIGFMDNGNNFIEMSNQAIELGLQMAVEEINNSGGLLGKNIRIMRFSNLSPESKDHAVAKSLAEKNKLLGIFAGRDLASLKHARHTAEDIQVPLLITMQTSDIIYKDSGKNTYIFSNAGRNSDLAALMINKALKYSGRVGILATETEDGKLFSETIISHLKRRGITKYYPVRFMQGENDFEPIVSKYQENGVEVVLFSGNAAELRAFLLDMSNLKYKFKVITNWQTTGTAGNFVTLATPKPITVEKVEIDIDDITKSQRFTSLINACALCTWDYPGNGYMPATLQTYDMAMMLYSAVKSSNSSTGYNIAKALEDIKVYNGLVKKYVLPFHNSKHEAITNADFNFLRTSCE